MMMNGNGNGKRAVLYARTSYDDRDTDGRNLAGQLEMAREHALSKGYLVVAEISEDDRGVSGAAFELEGLQQVLELAHAGEFDVLIPREIDRLSRNLAKQLIVEEELRRAGVAIDYVLGEYPDTAEGRLNKHIRATIAEYEREKIVERLTRGTRRKVASGSVMVTGNPPYGYRVVQEEGGRFMFVIHEPEAQVVRLIFDWYVCGDRGSGPLSMKAIVRKLDGIPTYADIHGRSKKREPGKWNKSVVYNMLKSETYAGIWHYGKRRRNDQQQWAHNPADSLLAVEVPAIVSRELWQAAQVRLAENKGNSRRNTKHRYLLSKRLVCGECKSKCYGVSRIGSGRRKLYQYYICPAMNDPDSARECRAPTFRADQVDAAVWEWVCSLVTNPGALARGIHEYQEEREKENAPVRERLNVVNDLLADNQRQLDRLLDLYLSGDFPKEVLTDRKARLETAIGALQRERASLAAHLEAHALTPGQIQSLHGFAARVGQGINLAEADFAERRGVIEDLNLWGELVVEDGQKLVRVSCVIGRGVCSLHPPSLVL